MSNSPVATEQSKPRRQRRPSAEGYARGRAMRERIIQEAIAAFAEVGFHGASLRDIAARTGITHAGLMHHFRTKDDLLMAVLAHRDEVDLADINADIAQGRNWLQASIRLMSRNMHRRAVVELFATLSAEATSPLHPAHGFFQDRYKATVGFAIKAFSDLRDAGLIAPHISPEQCGRAWIALMDGLQIQWLLSLTDPEVPTLDIAAELDAQLASLLGSARREN